VPGRWSAGAVRISESARTCSIAIARFPSAPACLTPVRPYRGRTLPAATRQVWSKVLAGDWSKFLTRQGARRSFFALGVGVLADCTADRVKQRLRVHGLPQVRSGTGLFNATSGRGIVLGRRDEDDRDLHPVGGQTSLRRLRSSPSPPWPAGRFRPYERSAVSRGPRKGGDHAGRLLPRPRHELSSSAIGSREQTSFPPSARGPRRPSLLSSMSLRKTSYPAPTRTLLCCRGEHGERPEHLGRGRERLREGALGSRSSSVHALTGRTPALARR
jgi:hypothetical protein